MSRIEEVTELYKELNGKVFVLQNVVALLATVVEDGDPEGIKKYLGLVRDSIRSSDLDFQIQKYAIQAVDYFPIPEVNQRET